MATADTGVIRDYDLKDRQFDLEFMQSVDEPLSIQQVSLGVSTYTPKAVTGPIKAVQRYLQLFLTTTGDIKYAPDSGSTVIQSLSWGLVTDRGVLRHLFNVSNMDILSDLRRDNENDIFGTVPDDEYITNAELESIELDTGSGFVSLLIRFTFRSGFIYSYNVPLPTGV